MTPMNFERNLAHPMQLMCRSKHYSRIQSMANLIIITTSSRFMLILYANIMIKP